ncbi:MAG: spore coat protein CotJB [Clostridia bacterium]|nr:spore coat protein CotJB [Clostridia bacterium]
MMLYGNELLKEIQAEDFAVYEAALYLDAHPNCEKALAYYREHKCAVKKLKEKYEELYGPLTIYSSADCDSWQWVNGPWPWEKEAN